jgi:putative spermidine/putrescine transport system permease protein
MKGRLAARACSWMFASTVIIFLALPSLVAIPLSFSSGHTLRFPPPGYSLHWYGVVLTPGGEWLRAGISSLEVAVGATIVSSVLGTLASVGLVRGRFPGRRALLAFFVSPLIVPVVVLAIGVFFVVVRLRLQAAGTLLPLVGAHALLGLPLVVLNVAASLARVNPDLELAASGLGARRWNAFRRVTLPLILPGIMCGALLAFVVSWDEVVMAIFLTDAYFRTMPVLMWGQVNFSLEPTLAVVATLMTILTTTALLGVVFLRRREVPR